MTSPDMAEVVVATSNPGKLREIRSILEDVPVTLLGLESFPDVVLPEEGDDYRANAVDKARTAAHATGRIALADDSGLEVEALGGGPGPRSARYGGPGLDDAGRVRALQGALEGVSEAARRARFVCVAALATPTGRVVVAEGELRGRILEAIRGEDGFGYDPIFEVEGRGQSAAELDRDEKNRISHRGKAFRGLASALLEALQAS